MAARPDEASWANWKLRDYPAPLPVPVKKRIAPPPTQVYLNLEDPLNPRLVAYTIPTMSPSKSPGTTPRRTGNIGKRITVFPSARLPQTWSHSSVHFSKSKHFQPHDAAGPAAVAAAPALPQLLGTPNEDSIMWGPAAAVPSRQTNPPSLSHLAAAFPDENKHSADPPPLSPFSDPRHHQQQQQQRKLEHWRRHRSGSAANGDVLTQHASAASRSWADDGTHVPNTFQSRSASVVSAVSCDNAPGNQRPATNTENEAAAPAKPPWVNPTDSSATQTEVLDDLVSNEDERFGDDPVVSARVTAGDSRPSDRSHDSVEIMQTKDGWETWAAHRPLTRMAAPTTSATVGTAIGNDREADEDPHPGVSSADTSDAEGTRQPPPIRLASIIRGTPRAPPTWTAVPVAAVDTSEASLVSGSNVADLYVRELQRQQEDMVALVLKQQRQIEELQQRQDVPSSTRVSPNEDAPVFSGAAARLGLAHEEQQPEVEAAQHGVTSHRSAALGTQKQLQSKTVQTPHVVVRSVLLDDEFEFDRQVERERILLRGILDTDLKARQMDEARQRAEAANLQARQALSRKLARHLAKPKKQDSEHRDDAAAPIHAPSSSASLSGLRSDGFRAPPQASTATYSDPVRSSDPWTPIVPLPSSVAATVDPPPPQRVSSPLPETVANDVAHPVVTVTRAPVSNRSTQVTPVSVADLAHNLARETAAPLTPPPQQLTIHHGNHELTFLQLRNQYLSLRGKSRSASTDTQLASFKSPPPVTTWQRV